MNIKSGDLVLFEHLNNGVEAKPMVAKRRVILINGEIWVTVRNHSFRIEEEHIICLL